MTSYTKKRTKIKWSRVTLIQVLFLILAGVIIAQLFNLQILKHDYYLGLAETRHKKLEELVPNRGRIYALNYEKNIKEPELSALADNQKFYLLYGVPSLIENATATIALIEKVLPMSDEERWETFLKLDREQDPYEPIRHHVTQAEKERLEQVFESEPDANFESIGFQDETKRIYPQDNLFSHVLGFIGYKDDQRVGQYGIEEYFEKDLAGQGGIVSLERDPKGRLIGLEDTQIDPVVDGSDLVLTLDPTIQFKACSVLEEWMEKMLAEDGAAIVLNPSNGHILAMCNKPDFDSNNYSQVEGINVYLNKSITEAYEPGSVIKAMTMAAAIDLEKLEPDTTYEDKGYVQFGPEVIYNVDNKTYGQASMTKVLEDSINTGAVFAAMEVGKKNFKKYMEKFGFGQRTEITLPAEHAGDISNLNNQGDIYTATASYGQGISVTPMQLAMAFGAIANGGILMQPQIVLQKISADGQVKEYDADMSGQEVRRVISSKTANILKAMLVSVIKNGHGYNADVDNYYVAGKTGTANIADPQGGYLKEQTNHTFVGFAPVDNPRFVILVKLGKPKNVPFSSDSAAPAFAQIAEFLVQYYQIAPDY